MVTISSQVSWSCLPSDISNHGLLAISGFSHSFFVELVLATASPTPLAIVISHKSLSTFALTWYL